MKDWSTELAFRDIFFQLPNLRNDPWLTYMYRQFREAEDEGERAPSIYHVDLQPSKRAIPRSDECSALVLMNLLTRERLSFILLGKEDHERI